MIDFKEIQNRILHDESLYPNSRNEIHKVACKNCPSEYYNKNNVSDPEFDDDKKMSKEFIAKNRVFTCGWRPSKLCKGYCDYFGIDEEYLKNNPTETY